MMRASRCRRTLASVVAAGAVCVGVLSLSPVVRGQEQFALYVFAVDEKGMPVLDLAASELVIREDAGESVVVSVRRTGWPLKVTVLVDNGARTADALVHYRTRMEARSCEKRT